MEFVAKKRTMTDKHSYVWYIQNIKPFLKTSEILQEKLKEAFFNREWDLMKNLIKQGAFINYRYDRYGETLLFMCTTSNEIKGLLDLGLDINAKNKNGQSVLGHAIKNCWSIDLVKLLLKCGADVNAQGPYGRSPLCLAVIRQAKNLELIKLMMEYKSNINGTDKYNKTTPIDNATTSGKCIKILIKYGVLHSTKNDCLVDIQLERQKEYVNFPNIQKYLEACIAEVMLMKQEVVLENRTLFDYLNISSKNNRLQIKTPVNLANYPIYADVIQGTIERVCKRNNLLKNLKAIHVHTSQEIMMLNYDSTFEIVKYLDNEDMENLITAFN